MGQYYKVVNITKKQTLCPYAFGNGAKLMEFTSDGNSIMQGVGILLADGNNRGGGDLRSENKIIGSWAGDKIVIAGDYADQGKFTNDETKNLYHESEGFEDISYRVIEALCEDKWWKDEYYQRWKNRGFQDHNEERQAFKLDMFKERVLEDIMGAREVANKLIQDFNS